MVNVPKTRWMFLKKRRKHQAHKRHRTRRAKILCMPRESGVMTGTRGAMVGRQPIFHKEANATKKAVPSCRSKRMLAIQRCKHFELGGDNKRKG
ncbi:60S ribosomal protein L36a-like [Lemmus lemmus]